MKVAMLTGGGDCPGLNAVMRAIVRRGERHYGDELIGFLDGWRGVLEDEWTPLDVERLRGTLPRGGTIIGSSRVSPFHVDGGVEVVEERLATMGIDALVVIGGEGTLGSARDFAARGLPIIGVPKTIDNDIGVTEVTFGFNTAVQVATEAIDRLHTTAESHDMVMVVEVMGRHAGHIATWAGVAGGATFTLIPEEPFDIGQVCDSILARHSGNRFASIVVVAEGALPAPGTLELAPREIDEYGHIRLGGIANVIAEEIRARTRFDTRVTILGYVQRGGTPTAYDRMLSTRFGIAAIDAVHDGAWGQVVALQCDQIIRAPLAEAVGELKLVDPDLYHGVAAQFFG